MSIFDIDSEDELYKNWRIGDNKPERITSKRIFVKGSTKITSENVPNIVCLSQSLKTKSFTFEPATPVPDVVPLEISLTQDTDFGRVDFKINNPLYSFQDNTPVIHLNGWKLKNLSIRKDLRSDSRGLKLNGPGRLENVTIKSYRLYLDERFPEYEKCKLNCWSITVMDPPRKLLKFLAKDAKDFQSLSRELSLLPRTNAEEYYDSLRGMGLYSGNEHPTSIHSDAFWLNEFQEDAVKSILNLPSFPEGYLIIQYGRDPLDTFCIHKEGTPRWYF